MWRFRGYEGNDEVGCLVNTLADRVILICGNGESVLMDLEESYRLGLADPSESPVFAVNDVGRILPHVDHWVSLHAEKFFSGQEKMPTHSSGQPGARHTWQIEPEAIHLSGYFAMQLAWIMGARQIILCGCPGNRAPRLDGSISEGANFGYGTGTSNSDRFIKRQLEAEMRRLPEFRAAVVSMSGWTREYFGGLRECQE